MSNVAILGCGPAGLLAAHAAEQAGRQISIHSIRVKSWIPGSQYLHEPIPGLHGQYPDNTVQYVRMGTAQGYAEKVYGDPSRPTGWEAYDAVYPSWNVVKTYDRLWERYEDRIVDHVLDYEGIRDIVLGYDTVISTIPAQALCHASVKEGHIFEGVPYFIRELELPPIDAHRDIVIYNGLPSDGWYRWSILSGRCSVESTFDMWPRGTDGITQGRKAVWNNCNCWPTVHRAGRWAEWRHGVLLHHAYIKAAYVLGRGE